MEREGGEGTFPVLTAGPERATEAIRKALSMGADKGVHLLDDADQAAVGAEAHQLFAHGDSVGRGKCDLGREQRSATRGVQVDPLADVSIATVAPERVCAAIYTISQLTSPAVTTCQFWLEPASGY
jgi:hypothetical protein